MNQRLQLLFLFFFLTLQVPEDDVLPAASFCRKAGRPCVLSFAPLSIRATSASSGHIFPSKGPSVPVLPLLQVLVLSSNEFPL